MKSKVRVRSCGTKVGSGPNECRSKTQERPRRHRQALRRGRPRREAAWTGRGRRGRRPGRCLPPNLGRPRPRRALGLPACRPGPRTLPHPSPRGWQFRRSHGPPIPRSVVLWRTAARAGVQSPRGSRPEHQGAGPGFSASVQSLRGPLALRPAPGADLGPGACPHHLLALPGACRLSCSVRGHIPSDWHPRGTQPPGRGDVESGPTHWVTPSTGGRSRGLVPSTPGRPSLAAPTCSEPTSHSARRWAWERWTVNQRDPGQPLGSASSLLPGLAARIPAAPQGPRGAAGRAPRGRAWGRVSRGQSHTAAGPRLQPSRWPLCPPELRGPGLLATGTCFYSVAWDFVASDGGGPPASSRRPAG